MKLRLCVHLRISRQIVRSRYFAVRRLKMAALTGAPELTLSVTAVTTRNGLWRVARRTNSGGTGAPPIRARRHDAT